MATHAGKRSAKAVGGRSAHRSPALDGHSLLKLEALPGQQPRERRAVVESIEHSAGKIRHPLGTRVRDGEAVQERHEFARKNRGEELLLVPEIFGTPAPCSRRHRARSLPSAPPRIQAPRTDVRQHRAVCGGSPRYPRPFLKPSKIPTIRLGLPVVYRWVISNRMFGVAMKPLPLLPYRLAALSRRPTGGSEP